MSKENDRAREIANHFCDVLEEEKQELNELYELVGRVRSIDIVRDVMLNRGYDSYKHAADWSKEKNADTIFAKL